MFWPTFLLVFIYAPLLEGSELKDMTEAVFAKETSYLPMAFGDFNADKLTDIFLVNDERDSITVLLAKEQTFSITKDQYFETVESARKKSLMCNIDPSSFIEAVVPGDFDGDGGMDVLLVTRDIGKEDNQRDFVSYVLWGSHDQEGGGRGHSLLCKDSGSHVINMTSQPLLMDANGDNVADLFGSFNGSIGFWTFPPLNGTDLPKFNVLQNETLDLRLPNSNAYVDLNKDGNADIFVTHKGRIALYENKGHNHGFSLFRAIPVPESALPGQSAFADFDLDGIIDVLTPVCYDSGCANSTMHLVSTTELWDGKYVFGEEMPLVGMNGWHFDPYNPEDGKAKDSPYKPLTPRVGDINLDGYPDILLRLRKGDVVQTHLLLNVRHEESPSGRGLLLQTVFMDGINRTVMATFYDLWEDGKQDIILVQENADKKFSVAAYSNLTQNNDAYFVKVIVLSGICYKTCTEGHIQVPYGTNLPGQSICYRTQRPGPEGFSEIQSCASQLTQTAHQALQLPYTIFGLGLSPNFLDYMYVNVTDEKAQSRSHVWPQIIPNSQLYVIPFPPTSPSLWEAKLFITPSRNITLTGLAMVGTCGLLLVIILILHWRERRQDHKEKLQEVNRFHFDAM